MKIPNIKNLYNQTFNSKFIEFVWIFDENLEYKKQLIVKFGIDGSIYFEGVRINKLSDEYVEGTTWCELCKSSLIESMWQDSKYNFIDYNFFSNGKDIVSLSNEVLDFLKNLRKL